jgi:hypothetical protein
MPRRHQHPGLYRLRRSIPRLYVPLSTLRRHPRGCLRMTRGRCGSLILHRNGLAPSTSCRPFPAHRGSVDTPCKSCVRFVAVVTAGSRSGRIEARTGLRMMPTSPRSPLSAGQRVFPSTAGRLAYQAGPTQFVFQLKPAPGIRCPTPGLSSPFVHLVADIGCPVLCRAMGSIVHRHAVGYPTYPRGPRSGPGYVVLAPHHLVGPMRPTRRHTATSPPSGLYAVPSLCGSA